jgi:hypothetical protein
MSKVSFSSPLSKRISMAIPVFIYGCRKNGGSFQEPTRTVVVDSRGGLIELKSLVVDGLRVLAVNENTGEGVESSVVGIKSSRNGKAEVWNTFEKPSPNFWGVKFSPEDWNPGPSKYAEARHFMYLRKSRGEHRPTEAVSLSITAVLGLKEGKLLRCFDALCDHTESKASANTKLTRHETVGLGWGRGGS